MNAVISFESYNIVEKMANKFAYGNTRSILFEQYKDAGIEGLKKAVDTYKENDTTTFSTYLYRCILNAMVNEKKRILRHDLGQEDENVDFNNQSIGGIFEMSDDNMEDVVKRIIRKHTTSDRNAEIVGLHIGLDCEPMELKDLAAMFGLSHESVRLVCVKTIKAIKTDKNAKELIYKFVG